MEKTRIIDKIFFLKNNCLKKENAIKDEFKLLPAEYKGIQTLGVNEYLTCSALSECMELSGSRGSRVIDRLVKNGYMKYENCDFDRRITFVKLTSKGKLIKSKIEQMLDDCEKEIYRRLNKSEINIFLNSVSKISNILKN
jgi:DNA-binding MarR family transcriptional regulator